MDCLEVQGHGRGNRTTGRKEDFFFLKMKFQMLLEKSIEAHNFIRSCFSTPVPQFVTLPA